MPRTTHPTKRLSKHAGAFSFGRLVQATLIVLAAAWLTSVLCVLAFSAHDGARPADAIVVLGAAQYAGRPSPVLRARIDHALALWRRDTSSTLIFTGGTGVGDTTSEAVVSSVYARRHGIPEKSITLESDGRTTSESMRSVAAILKAGGERRVILVSDPFHMFRVWILARRMGLEAYTSPTRTSPIEASTSANARYIFSESIKAPIAFLIEQE